MKLTFELIYLKRNKTILLCFISNYWLMRICWTCIRSHSQNLGSWPRSWTRTSIYHRARVSVQNVTPLGGVLGDETPVCRTLWKWQRKRQIVKFCNINCSNWIVWTFLLPGKQAHDADLVILQFLILRDTDDNFCWGLGRSQCSKVVLFWFMTHSCVAGMTHGDNMYVRGLEFIFP